MIHHLLKWVDQTLSKTFLCRRASYILIQNLNFKSDFNMVSDLLSYLLNLNILHSLRASLLLNDIFKEASTGCNKKFMSPNSFQHASDLWLVRKQIKDKYFRVNESRLLFNVEIETFFVNDGKGCESRV